MTASVHQMPPVTSANANTASSPAVTNTRSRRNTSTPSLPQDDDSRDASNRRKTSSRAQPSSQEQRLATQQQGEGDKGDKEDERKAVTSVNPSSSLSPLPANPLLPFPTSNFVPFDPRLHSAIAYLNPFDSVPSLPKLPFSTTASSSTPTSQSSQSPSSAPSSRAKSSKMEATADDMADGEEGREEEDEDEEEEESSSDSAADDKGGDEEVKATKKRKRSKKKKQSSEGADPKKKRGPDVGLPEEATRWLITQRYSPENRSKFTGVTNPKVMTELWRPILQQLDEKWGIKRTKDQVYHILKGLSNTYKKRREREATSGAAVNAEWPFHALFDQFLRDVPITTRKSSSTTPTDLPTPAPRLPPPSSSSSSSPSPAPSASIPPPPPSPRRSRSTASVESQLEELLRFYREEREFNSRFFLKLLSKGSAITQSYDSLAQEITDEMEEARRKRTAGAEGRTGVQGQKSAESREDGGDEAEVVSQDSEKRVGGKRKRRLASSATTKTAREE